MIQSRKFLVWSLLAAFTALAAVACGGDLDPANAPTQIVIAPQPTQTTTDATPTNIPAPTREPVVQALPTYAKGVLEVHGTNRWLNSEASTIADKLADNQIVLVDFWTYTCVNCLRTLPFLREWHAKYSDRGLVILGVHTPEFEFEEEYDNVAKALEREGIEWPILQDNDYKTWNSFANRFWPAKYLIGLDGQLRYRHYGEGQYVETEQAIRDTLTEAGHDVSDIPIGSTEGALRDPVANRITRELYGGYQRNYTQSGLYAG